MHTNLKKLVGAAAIAATLGLSAVGVGAGVANAATPGRRGPQRHPARRTRQRPLWPGTLWFAVGPLIWSQLPHVAILPLTIGTVFVGGIARLRSWQQRGRSHPVFIGAIALATRWHATRPRVAANRSGKS
jgi:hypothetical protein